MKCFTMIVPRSSSRTRNIRISNTVGIVDPSYCGPDDTLKVDLTRDSKKCEFVTMMERREGESLSQAHQRFYTENPSRSAGYFVLVPSNKHWHVFEEGPDALEVYKAGERFCQILFLPYYKPELVQTRLEEFGNLSRGGLGSTGQK
jgi:dUTPase